MGDAKVVYDGRVLLRRETRVERCFSNLGYETKVSDGGLILRSHR